ncbi:hypothetical protein EZS27_036454 [termite gut metagenome]|uniref:HTH cro/C1-type domain-containing protein n=1 Tax=termite gut metagenome TaxID=433724 RepID=A0A5J4PST2_9ZZZZ
MELKDRIKLIMRKENILPSAFAESIGVQQSTLSHILNGRNNPSLDVIMKIHRTYNYIDLEWLLYGIGELIENVKKPINTMKRENELPLFSDSFLTDQSNKTNRKESAITPRPPETYVKEIVNKEIKYIEKPPRKITEIRIFFDDNTFEIFKPYGG